MIYEPGQLIKLIKFSLNFAALQQRLFTVGIPFPLPCSPYSHLLISTSLSLHLSLGACHMHINSARPTKLFPVCLLRGVCGNVCVVCVKNFVYGPLTGTTMRFPVIAVIMHCQLRNCLSMQIDVDSNCNYNCSRGRVG